MEKLHGGLIYGHIRTSKVKGRAKVEKRTRTFLCCSFGLDTLPVYWLHDNSTQNRIVPTINLSRTLIF